MNKKALLTLFTGFLILTACTPKQAVSFFTPTTPNPTPIRNTPITITPTETTLEKLPKEIKSPIPSETPSQRVSLMAVGDIMLGRTIADLILEEGYQAPFEFTADTLQLADITIGNLECPISNSGEAIKKQYAFRCPPESAQALSFGGFDLLSLGNNHILDYGPDALEDTITALRSENLVGVGAGMNADAAYAPAYLNINGLQLAFLSFVDVPRTGFDYLTWEASTNQPGIAWAHPEKVRKEVQKAKQNADVVVVMFHNGYEFWQKPNPAQKEIAKIAIESGASLVIGSHPHVLQPSEYDNNSLIVYSMGNFVFDNFLFPPNYSAILFVELSSRGVENYELIDVVVQLNGVPQIMPYTIED